MKEALLVVDAHHYFCWEPNTIEKNEYKKVAARSIKEVLDKMRSKNRLIIFIMWPHPRENWFSSFQLAGETNFSGISGTTIAEYEKLVKDRKNSGLCYGCHYRDRLAEFLEHRHDPFEPIFFKDQTDAFTNGNLAKYLESKGVTVIKLVGGSTWACVLGTACGAVKNGFSVKLLSNCIVDPFTNRHSAIQWIRDVECYIPGNTKRDISVTVEWGLTV